MTTKEDPCQSPKSSHLFMLRLWIEDLGGGLTDWRGRIQHVNSGEVRYFRDWSTLQVFVEDLLHRSDLEATNTPGTSSTEC